MENNALIFSLIFFLFFVVYVYFGLYLFFSGPKEQIKRIFFVLIFTLSIWTFGFTIAISAPDYATCLLWRRISAIGWGAFFGALLHSTLILTEKKSLLKEWWIYFLIYLPSVIAIYAFSISNHITNSVYHLVLTQWGWINFSQNTVWDSFYLFYYSVYTIISVVLIFLWEQQATDLKIKKQANLLLYSYLFVFILSTVLNTLSNGVFNIPMPQIGPILMIAPVIALFYSIHYYGFIDITSLKNKEAFIDEGTRKKIYLYLSLAFISGSLINIPRYFIHENIVLGDILFLSALLFLSGIILQMIQRFNLNDNTKDMICVGMIALLIPMITLNFVEFGSITVWAFPFILIFAFLVFNKKKMIITIVISTICTQILVWILAPIKYVKVDWVDYITRIGLFCIAIWLVFYLNKLFVMRLNENNEKMKLQEMITKISSDCVKINQLNFEETIGRLLKTSGLFFSVDRSYICLFDFNNDTYSCIQEYCRQGIKSEKDKIQKLPIDKTHGQMEKILANKIFVMPDFEQIPANVHTDFVQLNTQLKSRILGPIKRKEKVIGFWGFESETSNVQWRDDHINFIKIFSNILGDTLSRLDSEKEINFMAYYDHITKLPNRTFFSNTVTFNIHKLKYTKKKLGIIFVDLDSFKTVNDTVGHGMGDELLFLVGKKLGSLLEKSDLVSRFSGDEFLIMINGIMSEGDIISIADRIMGLFYEPFILKGQEFFMTASTGISLYPRDGENAETLIMNADIAKYKAKEMGKNQYILCTSEIKGEVSERKQMINHLYRAIENRELFLVYQPQVSLLTEKITGVESLLRWEHPEMGLIAPSVIIPLAEQTGLINPIGIWVLETACRQNKRWQDMGIKPIQMAVNISASQFKNPKFINQVEEILKKIGMKPEYLEVEITESIAILEFNEIISKLNGLKVLGISIAIDDFGTEYSSLGRIKMLPLDRIKMDKQFVDGIGQNHKDQAVANAIIQLGKSLGLYVIAEGVETEEQMAFLKTSQCDLIQGFYYYKPMDAHSLEVILQRDAWSSQASNSDNNK